MASKVPEDQVSLFGQDVVTRDETRPVDPRHERRIKAIMCGAFRPRKGWLEDWDPPTLLNDPHFVEYIKKHVEGVKHVVESGQLDPAVAVKISPVPEAHTELTRRYLRAYGITTIEPATHVISSHFRCGQGAVRDPEYLSSLPSEPPYGRFFGTFEDFAGEYYTWEWGDALMGPASTFQTGKKYVADSGVILLPPDELQLTPILPSSAQLIPGESPYVNGPSRAGFGTRDSAEFCCSRNTTTVTAMSALACSCQAGGPTTGTAGFDRSLIWSNGIYWLLCGTCGVRAWDAEFEELLKRTIASTGSPETP